MSAAVTPEMPSRWTSLGDDPLPEADGGQDGGLGGGVEALDVGRRVELGEPERLGLGQGVGVGRARLGHAGEDVVGRAVDDAHHPVDPVAGERLPQRPEERDAPADRRLEQQVDVGGDGRLEQLGADVGQQLLVGADDRLARRAGRRG